MNMKKEMMCLLFKFVIKQNYDQCLATCCQDSLEKLTDLGYETFRHSPYSPDFLSINYIFFSSFLTDFYTKKYSIPNKKLYFKIS